MSLFVRCCIALFIIFINDFVYLSLSPCLYLSIVTEFYLSFCLSNCLSLYRIYIIYCMYHSMVLSIYILTIYNIY